jgi:hypothetical protein
VIVQRLKSFYDVVPGLGYSVVEPRSGRLLRRSPLSEDRPAIFAAQFWLPHGCWPITYPMAGWLVLGGNETGIRSTGADRRRIGRAGPSCLARGGRSIGRASA